MHQVLVTIATYASSADAYIIKGLLESAGVTCYVFDENMNFMYSNAVGGIKLKVPSSQLVLAREILAESAESNPSNDETKDNLCPDCGSSNIKEKKFSRLLFILSKLLFGISTPYPNKKFKCDNCGYTWRNRKSDGDKSF